MTPAGLALLATAFGLGSLLVTLVNVFLSPKTRAETRQLASSTAREITNDALDNLREDIKLARERAAIAEQRADRADARANELANRYNDLAEENRELLEYVWQIDAWARTTWKNSKHPPGATAPPVLTHRLRRRRDNANQIAHLENPTPTV